MQASSNSGAAVGIAALFLFFDASRAFAAPTPDAYFIDLERQWVAALQRHDTAFLDALLDDAFLDTTYRGTLRTKQQFLEGPPAAGAYRSIRLDDLLVRRCGTLTAIVTGVNVLQGPAHDVVRVRFTDVFVDRDARWRVVAAQETVQARD